MPDNENRIDAFVSILKKVRLRTDESGQIKERVLAFTHGNFVLDDCMPAFRAAAGSSEPKVPDLFAYEKSLMYSNMARFMEANPHKSKVVAAREHGRPLRLSVWYGTNLFRHVQPFYLKSAGR